MSIYTFIFDFKGGTYVDQMFASSCRAAAIKWAEDSTFQRLESITTREKLVIRNRLKRDLSLTPLKDLANVWYEVVLVGRYSGHLHIIKTSSTREGLDNA